MHIKFWTCALLGIMSAQAQSGQSRIVEVGPFDYGQTKFFSKTVGWALNGNRALARTTDGGATWTTIVPPVIKGTSTKEIRGRYFQSASAAWILVAPAPLRLPEKGRMLFRTLDGGETWTEQSLPGSLWTGDTLFADVKSGSVWLGGERATTSETTPSSVECPQRLRGTLWTPVIFYKGGEHSEWTQQTLPTENGCPASIVRFFDSQRGVAVSQNSVFYTEDAGINWHDSSVDTPGASESWHKIGRLPPATLFFLEGSDRIAWLSYQGGAMFKTTDGGEHWNQIAKDGDIWNRFFGFGEWGAVYFATEMVGWTLGGDGEVFETRDGGSSWSKLEVPRRVTSLSGGEGTCWISGADKLYRIEYK